MKEELEQQLYKIAPILYQQHSLNMQQTCMCWGFETPDTWYNLLYKLSVELEKLNQQLKDKNIEIQAVQVKEKFGSLRFYYDIINKSNNNFDTKELYKQVNELIDNAEQQSWDICCFCGKPATQTTAGWISRACDNCVKERGLITKEI